MSKRFKRQDYFRYKKLGKKWRRPRGRQSKMRECRGGAGDMPKIGYRTLAKDRYKIRGLTTKHVSSLKDIENLKEAILLSGKLGNKKRAAISTAAKEKGLIIINSSKSKRSLRNVKKKEEDRKLEKKMKELKKKEEASKPPSETKKAKTEKKKMPNKEGKPEKKEAMEEKA